MSLTTDTRRTAAVTGGSQRRSTIRAKSAAVKPCTISTVSAWTAAWYAASRLPSATEKAATSWLDWPYPIERAAYGRSKRLAKPAVVQICSRPATPARWSSCTRARCQTSQPMELESSSGRHRISSPPRPSRRAGTPSATRPKASMSRACDRERSSPTGAAAAGVSVMPSACHGRRSHSAARRAAAPALAARRTTGRRGTTRGGSRREPAGRTRRTTRGPSRRAPRHCLQDGRRRR